MKTKQCRRCKNEKQFIHFYKSNQNLDGLTSYCIDCCMERWKQYNISKKDIRLEQSKQYQKLNKEKVNAKNRKCRENNKQKYNGYSNKWAENNLERAKARQLFNAAKTRARNKKVNFSITINWIFEKLKNGLCEYSGMKFNFNKSGEPNLMSPSIDRINPEAGYTESNCKIVLYPLNLFKNRYDLNDLIPIAKEFIRYQSQ